MAIVAVIAMDLAALAATLPRIPNPGLALMVVILEVGLFRVADRRGADRAFWIGFESFGWAYVLAHLAFERAAWAYTRSFFEGVVIRAKISRPIDLWAFLAFAGGVQLATALAVAMTGGWLAKAMAMEVAESRAVAAGEDSPFEEAPTPSESP
jgi:hypothetical protein